MTERMTEEETIAADGELFAASKRGDQSQEAPERSDREVIAKEVKLDEVVEATTLTREMEEGFQIRDQAREKTIKITLAEAREYLVNPSASGAIPSDKDLVMFLKLCQAREANPWTGDIYLVGYDNRSKTGQIESTTWQAIPAYQLYMKRAENHPEYDGMESGVIVWDKTTNTKIEIEGDVYYRGEQDEDGNYPTVLIGGWSRVYRKDCAKPEYATARLSSYQKTKPVWENGKRTNKTQPSGYWSTDPSWMICKCARSKALKSAFPNECGDEPTAIELDFHRNAEAAELSNGDKEKTRIGEGSAADQL